MKYQTLNQNLAVALHATNLLPFLGCRKADTANRVVFEFDDPGNVAPQAELDYAASRVVAPVNVVLAAQRFLRQRTTETLKG